MNTVDVASNEHSHTEEHFGYIRGTPSGFSECGVEMRATPLVSSGKLMTVVVRRSTQLARALVRVATPSLVVRATPSSNARLGNRTSPGWYFGCQLDKRRSPVMRSGGISCEFVSCAICCSINVKCAICCSKMVTDKLYASIICTLLLTVFLKSSSLDCYANELTSRWLRHAKSS